MTTIKKKKIASAAAYSPSFMYEIIAARKTNNKTIFIGYSPFFPVLKIKQKNYFKKHITILNFKKITGITHLISSFAIYDRNTLWFERISFHTRSSHIRKRRNL